jgi:CRISPR-associated endonuclease/helicase Cas3
VDLDFPLVLRAVGPLDRVVQAAGRCNREGKLDPDRARVVVFDPLEGGRLPGGEYQTATDNTRVMLRSPGFNFHDPATYKTYFRQLYQLVDLDAEGVQAKRRSLDFPAVAESFRMIKDDTVPVVVHYAGPTRNDRQVDSLVSAIHTHPESFSRSLLRQLQPYLVNLDVRMMPTLQANGLVVDLLPGLAEWVGLYDPVWGLVFESRDPE